MCRSAHAAAETIACLFKHQERGRGSNPHHQLGGSWSYAADLRRCRPRPSQAARRPRPAQGARVSASDGGAYEAARRQGGHRERRGNRDRRRDRSIVRERGGEGGRHRPPPEPIHAVAAEVDGRAVAGDTSDDEHVRAAVATAVDAFGGLDVLVANAGSGFFGATADLDDEHWQRTLDVNLTGAFRLALAAIPSLIERGGGSIVVVSSTAGLVSGTENAAYETSKAALIGHVHHVRSRDRSERRHRVHRGREESHATLACRTSAETWSVTLGSFRHTRTQQGALPRPQQAARGRETTRNDGHRSVGRQGRLTVLHQQSGR